MTDQNMEDLDDKRLPLNAPQIPVPVHPQDCPDGMIPAMLLLAVMTTMMVVLILMNEPLSEQR